MPTVISLKEVVDAISFLSDDVSSYLDPDTGKIITISEDERRLVEEGEKDELENLPEWQLETLPKVREVLESDRFLELPDKFDVHEWDIMRQFAEEQRNQRVRNILSNAIHGSGAFRRFRADVEEFGLLQSWYRFREAALEEIARDWLEEHNLPYK
jgi:hypothetical protein